MDPTINTRVTHGIRITVRSLFVPEQSSAKTGNYVFAYRIHIRNESDQTVQLMRRHWDIVDSHCGHREVDGDGVVGIQPVLRPGQDHSYVSGCVLDTPIGTMAGYYVMEVQDGHHTGESFQVEIPTFQLITPFLLN